MVQVKYLEVHPTSLHQYLFYYLSYLYPYPPISSNIMSQHELVWSHFRFFIKFSYEMEYILSQLTFTLQLFLIFQLPHFMTERILKNCR
jgi:hypothetical protein